MRTCLVVNNSEKSCGVFQYGKRVANIFKRSDKWTVIYCEPESEIKLGMLIQETNPNIILYNYLSITMAWLTHAGVNRIRAMGIKQGLIVHNTGYAQMFDFYLHQVPNWPTDANNFTLMRPLFDYRKPDSPPNKIPRIGGFGFAFWGKRHPEICQMVNAQFDEAEIHLHLTVSHYFPNYEELNQIAEHCRRAVTKPGIKLTITTDFRDDEAILDFLAGNDLNVFLYAYFPHYNGLSSTVDYALSVKKPIAVCRSGLFSHINNVTPSICVEDNSLPQIMANGFTPALWQLTQDWSNENFIRHLEGVLERV